MGAQGGHAPPIIFPNYRKKVHIFLKKVHFFRPRPEKCGTLRVNFWKTRTSTWKNVDFCASFFEKMDLYLRNVDLYVWFSEKSGPWPKNVDLLRSIFWKMCTFMLDFLKKKWTVTWKMRTFTEKRGPRLKNVDLLHMIFEKFGPSCWIIWNKWTLTWKMWTFASTWKCGFLYICYFLKKVDLYLRNVDL